MCLTGQSPLFRSDSIGFCSFCKKKWQEQRKRHKQKKWQKLKKSKRHNGERINVQIACVFQLAIDWMRQRETNEILYRAFFIALSGSQGQFQCII